MSTLYFYLIAQFVVLFALYLAINIYKSLPEEGKERKAVRRNIKSFQELFHLENKFKRSRRYMYSIKDDSVKQAISLTVVFAVVVVIVSVLLAVVFRVVY